ncbi:MAG TPA: protein kinase [Candidatus Limnocylindria bacterium]|nr:protein kinase [Candidatus Limnocylindria bacterium]
MLSCRVMVSEETRIGPYIVLERLGAGGMGEVFLARDSRLGRDVALKMLPPELARNAEGLAWFRREALTLAALNHPNIAIIHGFEDPGDGRMALVLERIEGESLADRLLRGPLGFEEALGVCAQIAEALEVAHERGVVHRDLKPGNVMLGPRGLVKVLDFGLARRTVDAGALDAPDETGVMVGTPGYMSPEQLQGGDQDERTDVFSYGCVMYECLTGHRAFQGASELELLASMLYSEPDRALLPERTPAPIRALLDSCLEKDPEQRLREIRTARLAIEEALGIRRASALRAGEALPTPHNLPRALTSFVGREQELEICGRQLAETRLLTLTGVGGGGKTRLALELAERRLGEFPDGIWVAALASLADGTRVPETVAAVLGVREEPGHALVDTISAHLASRRVLIVLDNCEHVLDSSAAIANHLLSTCPDLKLLATSREGLGVSGERLHVVPSLAVPPAVRGASAETVARAEAVVLFVERARLAVPDFELDGNAEAVADICRRLDGIPLAIELAAARVRILDVPEIRAKLDDRFRLLTGGSKTALPRHQTLRAAIQWSVDHLAEPEQQFLRSLAAFAGGWTLSTATAVCMEEGDEFTVLDLLTRLVDKSLVVVERRNGGAARYRFLETVHQFALEQLDAAGEGVAVRGRHLAYFLAVAETAERKLVGPDQGRWFADLEVEHENLLAAFAWCAQVEGGVDMGLRLSGSIARFWSAHGHLETGRRTLDEALRRDGARTPSQARATALVRAGGLAIYQCDYASARPLVEESLATYRALGDRKGVARSLSGLGTVATYQGDLAAARRFSEEGLALYRELGEKRGVAVCLNNLGYVAQCQGDLPRARELYDQALALLREVGDQEYVALSLADLGRMSTRLGEPATARAQLAEGLHSAQQLGVKNEAAYLLEAAAELLLALGNPAQAARLLGAAQAVREAMQIPGVPAEQQDRDALWLRLCSALSDDGAANAAAEGRAMSLPEAVEEALQGLGAAARGPAKA